MDDSSAASSTQGEEVGERRAGAMAESILELIGIFTHDLSNPLQSLTVLLELTLDDLTPGTESHTKLEQSLDASERMRDMIRDFAGLARMGQGSRAGEQTVGAVWRRASTVLRRRFERHKIQMEADLDRIEGMLIPDPIYEMVFLTVLLAAVSSASRSEHATFVLKIEGTVPANLSGDTARVEIGLSGHRHVDQTLSALELGDPQMRRARALLGEAGHLYVHSDGAARLEFPLRAPPA